jgi:mannosyltransferase
MRILYLTNNPNVGSSMRVFLDWFLIGRAEGLESFVVAQKQGHLTRWLADSGFDHCLSPMPWPSRRWPVPSLWQAWKVARWARRRGIDLIHSVEQDVYPFALLVQRLLRRPLLVHCHFVVGRDFCTWAFGGRRRPEALVWTTVTQRDACAAEIAGIVPEERQHVIPIGVSLEQFGHLAHTREAVRRDLGIEPGQLVIGTASQIAQRKRIHEFVELVKRLAPGHPRLVGLIAGGAFPCNQPYLQEVRRQIAASGLGDRLRWLDRLEPLEPFLHALDVFVSASEYETFGMSVCEAMACRRPVAAYRGGSVGEVVGDAGLVVETGDFEGLCAAAGRLLGDARLREELGARGRQRVATVFNPAVSFRQMKAIYQAVLLQGKQAASPARATEGCSPAGCQANGSAGAARVPAGQSGSN